MEFGTASLLIAFIVAVAVLGPVLGADSRDGRDWRPTGPRTKGSVADRLRGRARRQAALWDAYLTDRQATRESGPLRWRKAGSEWVLDGATAPRTPAARSKAATRPAEQPRPTAPDDDAQGLHPCGSRD
ncbi:hypothetical protein [Yinghuangia seranimata]|uniref:hypothetical protein n=1 Tax=Yinghuangia seranimata TaxID=408067 RepID=UPI00248B476B|nr:hypothetical protein [Yinghuangia seranimata]MDI2129779.1 hypothetical protein [Yinghuangia seranimata]